MDRLTEPGAHYDDQYAVALQEIEDKLERGEMVEVVRCRDCAYRDDDNAGTCAADVGFLVTDYTFCSKGKRKEPHA